MLTWVGVTLVGDSDVGGDFLAALLWLFFTFGLGVSWLAFVLPAAYRTWKRARLRGIGKIFGYVVPLPLAAVGLFLVIPDDTLTETRFELSESQMLREVQRFESSNEEVLVGSHRVGLFRVDVVHRRDGCVILKTGGFIDYEGGFAYCAGSLPTSPTVHMKHIKDRWWIYENIH